MKRGQKLSPEDLKTRERERVLNNFYIKEMKKGKTYRAVIFDKIALSLGIFILLLFTINNIIKNFFIALIFSVCIGSLIGIYGMRLSIKYKNKKINEFKKEYRLKLEEEKLISPEDDMEDYLMERYYNKKEEFKSNFKLLSKDKVFKFYMLFVLFYLISYFVPYSLYYKIMAVISFILGTVIGSYNLTEYIKKKDKNDLLNRDINV